MDEPASCDVDFHEDLPRGFGDSSPISTPPKLVPVTGLTDPAMAKPADHENPSRQLEGVVRRRRAAEWVETMTGVSLNTTSETILRSQLKDGKALCKLMNCVESGLIPKVDDSPEENLQNFIAAVRAIGMSEENIFLLSDLTAEVGASDSMARVVDCILELRLHWQQRNQRRQSMPATPGNRRHSMLATAPYPNHGTTFTTHAPTRDGAGVPPSPGTKAISNAAATAAIRLAGARIGAGMGTGAASVSVSRWMQQCASMLREKLRGINSNRSPDVRGGVPVDSGVTGMDVMGPVLESVLSSLMTEYEKRLVLKDQNLTKLKASMEEAQRREDKLMARNAVLEALASGTTKEVQVYAKQLKRVEEEKEHYERVTRERVQHELARAYEAKARRELEEAESRVRAAQEAKAAVAATAMSLEAALEAALKEVAEREAAPPPAPVVVVERVQGGWSEESRLALRGCGATVQGMQACLADISREVNTYRQAWMHDVAVLGEQVLSMSHTVGKYKAVVEENKRLYNLAQDLKGNIRVYCRVRPLLGAAEQEQGSVVSYSSNDGDILITNPKTGASKLFHYDLVFDQSATQAAVYEDMKPLVRSVLDGYNVCVFAYGQTGSGKTYTMSGPPQASSEMLGVNFKALEDLFDLIRKQEGEATYEVSVQMLEIYNEMLRDLLISNGPGAPPPKKLDILSATACDRLNVPDALLVPVRGSEDVRAVMALGQSNRATSATNMNERSSRSHSVVTVHVTGRNHVTGATTRACLHLVDLAGSERVSRSEATGDRLKEAQHINKSLSALGDVMAALAANAPHIPYRNSKLTTLLQDALGGQAKVCMFAHASPDAESFGETISTLSFAQRVSAVTLGAARKNTEGKEVQEARDQVSKLRTIVDDKSAELKAKDKEIARLEHALASALACKDKEVSREEASLRVKQVESARLSATVAELQDKLAAKEGELARAMTEASKAKALLAEAEAEKSRLAKEMAKKDVQAAQLSKAAELDKKKLEMQLSRLLASPMKATSGIPAAPTSRSSSSSSSSSHPPSEASTPAPRPPLPTAATSHTQDASLLVTAVAKRLPLQEANEIVLPPVVDEVHKPVVVVSAKAEEGEHAPETPRTVVGAEKEKENACGSTSAVRDKLVLLRSRSPGVPAAHRVTDASPSRPISARSPAVTRREGSGIPSPAPTRPLSARSASAGRADSATPARPSTSSGIAREKSFTGGIPTLSSKFSGAGAHLAPTPDKAVSVGSGKRWM
eukprot:jgi/Mesvir1/26686/Mv20467-RA.1